MWKNFSRKNHVAEKFSETFPQKFTLSMFTWDMRLYMAAEKYQQVQKYRI